MEMKPRNKIKKSKMKKKQSSLINNLKCEISSLGTCTGLIQLDGRKDLYFLVGRLIFSLSLVMRMPVALRKGSLETKLSNREGLF